ncbi:MAG: ExbD/TolR family protein [Planctomycetota bacterium]|jgi:biopolymer transport protein ExbD
MRLRRSSKLLVEPPSSATGDIAFNLIVFFLVCASVQPDSGRKQSIPSSETVEETSQQTKNIEVALTRTAVFIDGNIVPSEELESRIRAGLRGRSRPDERVVVVKSKPDVPYKHWIDITTRIEDAGGIVTLQIEEARQVQVPG